jgi:hypothetical protein
MKIGVRKIEDFGQNLPKHLFLVLFIHLTIKHVLRKIIDTLCTKRPKIFFHFKRNSNKTFWHKTAITVIFNIGQELISFVIWPAFDSDKIWDKTWNLTFEQSRVAQNNVNIVSFRHVLLSSNWWCFGVEGKKKKTFDKVCFVINLIAQI